MAQFIGEIGAEVAEAAGLALVKIFGNAAGKRHGIDALVGELGWPRLRDHEPARQFARLAQVDEPHDQARHARGDALAGIGR